MGVPELQRRLTPGARIPILCATWSGGNKYYQFDASGLVLGRDYDQRAGCTLPPVSIIQPVFVLARGRATTQITAVRRAD